VFFIRFLASASEVADANVVDRVFTRILGDVPIEVEKS
jgi:hypothetical protein